MMLSLCFARLEFKVSKSQLRIFMEFKPKRFTNRDLQLATDEISVIKFVFFLHRILQQSC
jgi:uncharacterized protein YpmS